MTQIPGIGSSDSSTTNALDPTTAIGSPTKKTGPLNAHGTLARWGGQRPPPPPTWSKQRTRAIQHIRAALDDKTDPRTCVSATWLLERLHSGEKCLFPLLERRVERQEMPPGAKWKFTLRHLHAIRVIATAQFDCGEDRPNGLIASYAELGALIGGSESTAKRAVKVLKEWHLIGVQSRKRPGGDGVGQWAARNLYTLSAVAISYWSISTRRLRPGPAKSVQRKPAPDRAIPVNPDGTPPANPEGQIGLPNSPLQISYSLPDTNSPSRVKPPIGTGPRSNFGPASPASPTRAPRPSIPKPADPPAALPVASSEAGPAAVLDARPPPPVERLQPPIRVPRATDEELTAAKALALIRERYGEPTPEELLAVAQLRRGGRA